MPQFKYMYMPVYKKLKRFLSAIPQQIKLVMKLMPETDSFKLDHTQTTIVFKDKIPYPALSRCFLLSTALR